MFEFIRNFLRQADTQGVDTLEDPEPGGGWDDLDTIMASIDRANLFEYEDSVANFETDFGGEG